MKIWNARPVRLGIAVFASVMFVAGCGSSTRSGDAKSDVTAGNSDKPSASVMPDVDVLDVANGNKVAFGELSPSEKPLLLWFWAPH